MPRPRSKRARVHQVANWLRENFPPPYPTSVRFQKLTPPKRPLREFARAELLVGPKYLVLIEPRAPLRDCLDSLIHEWAHVVTTRQWHVEKYREEHDDEWALAYGRIYRVWMDEGGAEESVNWPTKAGG